MASLQTDTAISVITELYGEPDWLTKPKEGQNVAVILAEWDEELRRYSEEQVKTAIRKMWKYSKTKSVPRLGHIIAELSDVPPEGNNATERQVKTADDTVQRLTATYVRNGCRGRLCFASDVAKAFNVMIDDMIAELPREATAEKTFSDLQQLAKNNGYLARFEDYLAEVTKNRSPYQPINDELRVIDVPELFSPNNKMRKCA